jgi:hypothetical protein
MVAACALALARIDRREARQLAPLLAAALARGAPAQEAPMLQALRDLGPEAADAVPAVVRVLQRNAAGRRGEAVATLAAIGPAAAAAVGPLQVALDDPKATDEERVAVIQALAKIGPVATAGPILERVVAGPDPFLTLVAAAGLDRLRPQTPYPEGRWKAWVEAATRHDRATRKPAPVYPNSSRDNGGHFFTPLLQAVDAAHTLSPAAGPWLAPVVALALNRPSTEDWTLWEDAVKIAPRFGPAVKPAAPALVDDFLRHQGPVGRPEQLLEYPPAVPALVALGPETAIPALAARLGRAAEPDFNLPLAFALFGAPAVRPLMDLLDDEERCLGAVTALGYLGDAARPAVPALGALTRHEEFAVRRAAVTALLRIDPAAVPPLP